MGFGHEQIFREIQFQRFKLTEIRLSRVTNSSFFPFWTRPL